MMRATDFFLPARRSLCPLAGAGAVMCMLLLFILVPGCMLRIASESKIKY
jgi:hypothetical protein